MSDRASFTVSSVEEGRRVLDHLNGFHDGFMKRLVITSQDGITQDLGQTCTGAFDIAIDFAHYNYGYTPGVIPAQPPFRPHDQIVHAEFRNVRDLFYDFGEGYLAIRLSAWRSSP